MSALTSAWPRTAPACWRWWSVSTRIGPPAMPPESPSFTGKGSSRPWRTKRPPAILPWPLAGRAKNVAPVLAERVPLDDAKLLVDIGGGTGIYSIALLQKNPQLCRRRAGSARSAQGRPGDGRSVWRRRPFADAACRYVPRSVAGGRRSAAFQYSARLGRRRLPNADWPIGGIAAGRRAALIHDVFLNDALDGPLPMALYLGGFVLLDGRPRDTARQNTAFGWPKRDWTRGR